ncbi:MAG: hypothetical protein NTU74_08405 [Deltaproteobacteria bacterium]|nr:hypothetical protein [Deltaproteobacteria bacterium]
MKRAIQELPAGECNKAAVKAGIRESHFDGANPFRADAKTDDSQRDVDQVGLAEGLDY